MGKHLDQMVSGAFNFGKKFSTGVDPRTGTFQLGFVLSKFIWGNGHIYELKLGYNSRSMFNIGFGQGWSLNLPNYHLLINGKKGRISLSNGDTYPCQIDSKGKFVIDYAMLHNFKANYSNLTKALTITYKEGTKEIYHSDGRLRTIISASGHVLSFNWVNITFKHLGKSITIEALYKINDNTGKEININYKIKNETLESTITIGPNKEEDFKLFFEKSKLTKLHSTFYKDDNTYKIKYTDINDVCVVTEVVFPTGLTEEITYNNNAIKFPEETKHKALPAVTKHRVYASKAIPNYIPAEVIRTYSYSTTNFLGYGVLKKYNPNEDGLLELEEEYKYNSVETQNNESIRRTYNKFHLLITESNTEAFLGDLYRQNTIDYYAFPGKSITKQPAQYKFPKKMITLYFNNGRNREDIIETTYDQYGNETYHKSNYGIITENEYYPAQGETGKAPKTESGFPYLLKRQRIIPSEKNRTGEEREIRTYYTYKNLTQNACPVVSTKENYSNDTKINSSSYEYINDLSNPILHGKKKQQVSTEGTSTLTEKSTYTNTESKLFISIKGEIGNDSYENKQELCLYTGHELGGTDRLGNQHENTFDKFGRLTKNTIRLGTTYEMSKRYTYVIKDGKNQLHIQTSTDTQELITYDQFGREISRHATDATIELSSTQSFTLMESTEYNSIGHIISHTNVDRDCTYEQKQTTTHYEYDFFGNQCKTIFPSGVCSIRTTDLVSLTVTEYLCSTDKIDGPKTITSFNELALNIKKEYPTCTESSQYDGAGKIISETNTSGIKTHYKYDIFDRNYQEITLGLESPLKLEKTYDLKSNSPLVSELTLNGDSLGVREYDNFKRVVKETKGLNIETKYTYDTLSDKPTKITQPDGGTINYTLDLHLDEILSYKSNTGESGSYLYDDNSRTSTSLPTMKKNKSARILACYYKNGLLKSVTQHDKSSLYKYSLHGNIIIKKDFFGHEEKTYYDSFRRIKKIEWCQNNSSPSITVNYSYDTFDRVKSISCTSIKNGFIKITNAYDEQHRLLNKKTSIDNKLTHSQIHKYRSDNKLLSREFKSSATNRTDLEEYTYDKKGGIKTFERARTLDSMNIELENVKQIFTYDIRGNITNLSTTKKGIIDETVVTNQLFTYNKNDQLETMKNDLETISFKYNKNGDLLTDEVRRTHKYNVFGQLKKIEDDMKNLLAMYDYDADGIKISQHINAQKSTYLFYSEGAVINEFHGENHSVIFNAHGYSCRFVISKNGEIDETILITDFKGSCIVEINNGNFREIDYFAYGDISSDYTYPLQ